MYINNIIGESLFSKLKESKKSIPRVKVNKKLDDEWPESIFHHVGSQSASYPVSVQ